MSLAHPAHRPTTPEQRWRSIRERTTRGMLLYNASFATEALRLEGGLWAVRSSQGGFYKVDLDAETCDCPDFEHYGSANDVCCKHLFAVAIAHAHRRCRVASITSAGDPFVAAGKTKPAKCDGCGLCFARRDMVELDDTNHDNLTYFHGDILCLGCADAAGVPW